jgi:hypothetical protein
MGMGSRIAMPHLQLPRPKSTPISAQPASGWGCFEAVFVFVFVFWGGLSPALLSASFFLLEAFLQIGTVGIQGANDSWRQMRYSSGTFSSGGQEPHATAI